MHDLRQRNSWRIAKHDVQMVAIGLDRDQVDLERGSAPAHGAAQDLEGTRRDDPAAQFDAEDEMSVQQRDRVAAAAVFILQTRGIAYPGISANIAGVKKAISYRFRIYPGKEQEAAFWRIAGCCRLVYNIALEQRRDYWRGYHRATGRQSRRRQPDQ